MALCVCLWVCRLLEWGGGCFGGGVCVFFLKTEQFLYAWNQFAIEGTADISSKMGLGEVSQRK